MPQGILGSGGTAPNILNLGTKWRWTEIVVIKKNNSKNEFSLITITSCDIEVWNTTKFTLFELSKIRLVYMVNICYQYVIL